MADWVERPAAEDLDKQAGYVRSVYVDQVGARDNPRFLLQTYGSWGGVDTTRVLKCVMFLDQSRTVALAQLQLLRDAMHVGWPVRIFYLLDEDNDEYDTYLVDVIQIPAELGYPLSSSDIISYRDSLVVE